MKSLAVVVLCSMMFWRNDGYVRTINCPSNICDSVQILEFIREFIHHNICWPSNEFFKQKYIHGLIELRYCQLTSGNANPIQICNALYGITCGQPRNRDNHLKLNRNCIVHIRILPLHEGCE